MTSTTPLVADTAQISREKGRLVGRVAAMTQAAGVVAFAVAAPPAYVRASYPATFGPTAVGEIYLSARV